MNAPSTTLLKGLNLDEETRRKVADILKLYYLTGYRDGLHEGNKTLREVVERRTA